MARGWFPVVWVLVAGVIGGLLGVLLGRLGEDGGVAGEFGRFDNARTVHTTPDGRLIVADLGTGRDDGRVVAVTLDGKQEVLMDHLPSTRHSGQAHSDLSGPSGAAMNDQGIICAVIGDGPTAEYATMRCNEGLRVDLKAFERANNPDGRELESNPFDIASDGADGWVVSDAAANDVLHVSGKGEITVLAAFWTKDSGAAEGVPTGLTLVRWGEGKLILVALFGGGIQVINLNSDQPPGPIPDGPRTIAVTAMAPTVATDVFIGMQLNDLVWDDVTSGGLLGRGSAHEIRLNQPTGMAQLNDKDYVVVEAGQLRRVTVG